MFEKIRELAEYRELLLTIAVREIKVRYKQSVLGIFWSILQPLSMMIIFTIVFSRFVKVPSDGIPYPLFFYTALLPWTFFATSLSGEEITVGENPDFLKNSMPPCRVPAAFAILAAAVD